MARKIRFFLDLREICTEGKSTCLEFFIHTKISTPKLQSGKMKNANQSLSKSVV